MTTDLLAAATQLRAAGGKTVEEAVKEARALQAEIEKTEKKTAPQAKQPEPTPPAPEPEPEPTPPAPEPEPEPPETERASGQQ